MYTVYSAHGVYVNISVHTTLLHMEAVVLELAKLNVSLYITGGQNMTPSLIARTLLCCVIKGQWCERPFGIKNIYI